MQQAMAIDRGEPTGIPVPTPEYPTSDQLAAYGSLAFLYLRSEPHSAVPLRMARLAIQPPIDLGLYKIFEQDGVPRAAMTWAYLSSEAECKLVAGDLLAPSDWMSGLEMWVMQIIAPYGEGSGAFAVNWLRKNLPTRIQRFRWLRVGRAGIRRIGEARRMPNGRWGAHVIAAEQFTDGRI